MCMIASVEPCQRINHWRWGAKVTEHCAVCLRRAPDIRISRRMHQPPRTTSRRISSPVAERSEPLPSADGQA